MPIKLNLLAEAQAAEELRRKDPVKRFILGGALVVFGMLLWSAYLYWENASALAEQRRYETTWKGLEPKFNALSAEQKLAAELQRNMTALDRYTTNRFLWGTALNAVQQTIPQNLVPTIQMTRLNGAHSYQVVEGVAPRKVKDRTEPGRPATSTERIVLTIEARDHGNPADQNFNKYKNSILSVPYFKEALTADGVLLKSVGQPVRDMLANKQFVQFTLECQFPPTTRNE